MSAFAGETGLAGAVACLQQSLDEGSLQAGDELTTALRLYERYAQG
ncbi:hypothetical protein [Streptomyces cyaneochromogenes]|nr:hypothetical protein [Streptomyces cyaneochromogenes]